MIHLVFGRSKYAAPESWAECTPAQRWELTVYHRIPPADRSETIEMMVARIWLGVSPRAWSTWALARYQWGQLRQQFRWIFDTEPTGQPAPSFTHNGSTYYLPDDNFTNTTALEVALANMAYLDFAHPDQPDPTALDTLIATLCRPERPDLATFRESLAWNGDRREPFNEARSELRATALADLPLPLKVSLLDYFERMNTHFLQQFSEMFGGDAQPRYGDGRGWIMMLKNAAKTGTFGPFDQVCQQPAHLFWATCLDDILDDRDRADAETQATNQHTHEN